MDSNLTTYRANLNKLLLINHQGVELDLIPFYSFIKIDVSIYNYLNVYISLNDSVDFIKNMKLIGGETLELHFKSSAKDNQYIKLNLVLNKIILFGEELTNLDKSIKCKFEFISPEVLENSIKTICKKYSDVGSSIVKTIFKDSLKSTDDRLSNIDATSNSLELWCNNEKAFNFIEIVRKRDFNLFFEDVDGFYYKPIDGLLIQSPSIEYDMNVNFKSLSSFTTLKSFKYDNIFSMTNNGILGFYGTTIENFDSIYYKINRTSKTNSELVDLIGKNGNRGLIKSDYDNYNSIHKQNYGNINNNQKLNNFNLAISNWKMSVVVNGDSNFRCGKIIKIKHYGHDNEGGKNENLFGNWFVSSISHLIEKDISYKLKLTVSKVNMG